MKKLNNHGLTAVEVLICFSITAVIVISLFKIINNFKDKQYIESNKNLISTYKNTVTKTIQDDVLLNGGVKTIENADTFEEESQENYDRGNLSVKLIFSNNKKGQLDIEFLGVDSDENKEEYIQYTSYDINDNELNTEKFTLEDIPRVEFNEPKIDYDEDNGLLSIHVGISDLDFDLGDKYEILDITLPLTDKWPNAYVRQ